MFILYVDESGDTGLSGSPTRYFALSGLVVHELSWRLLLDDLIALRRNLRTTFGLKLREEIHAQNFLHSPGPVVRIAKSRRLQILREVLDAQASLTNINIISVICDKNGKPPTYDVFEHTWRAMIQRFHNTIGHRNFPGPANPQDFGVIITDQTSEIRLRLLTRRLATHNPIPNMGRSGYRNIPIPTILEDAVHRDSLHSYFVQCADVNSYFLVQRVSQCSYVRKKGARNFFARLRPVLCLPASTTDPLGIVRL